MDKLSMSIVPGLGKTTKLIHMFIDSELINHGFDLTVKQWIILRILANSPGLMQNELAFLTDRNKTSLTRLLQTMEQKKLVHRRSDRSDGRAKRIFLSTRGKKYHQKTEPIILEVFKTIERGIPASDLKHVRNILNLMQQNIRAHDFSYQLV